jgi:hypothetical protein
MRSPFLSKSNYLIGLQCAKYLWTLFHEPEKIPPPDNITQHRFDQGHLVGQLAKKLFPDGIDITTDNFSENVKLTGQLMAQHKPLFEAGIQCGNIYCRVDILHPAEQDKWNIIEIKSSTSVKDEHFDDVSFQKFCCDRTGLEISNCYLMHLNNQYVRKGEINPAQLFIIEEISAQVNEAGDGIADRIDEILALLAIDHCPDVPIGNHCGTPYSCPLIDTCWDFLRPGNIFELYGRKVDTAQLLEKGIFSIREIPDEFLLSDKHRIQKTCEITGKPHIDTEGISRFLVALQYPYQFLDFETVNVAIPLFDGTSPYQQIPFQFSLHIKRDTTSELEHVSFLSENADDPRPALFARLRNAIVNEGSIIVYNQSFEESILTGLADAFPEYGDWIDSVCDRLIDLLTPFRSFKYYHPEQGGTASLKSVLPALTGRSYDCLRITDGQEAGLAFLDTIYGNISDEERNQTREDLQKYCGLDSEGMALIIDKLTDLSC